MNELTLHIIEQCPDDIAYLATIITVGKHYMDPWLADWLATNSTGKSFTLDEAFHSIVGIDPTDKEVLYGISASVAALSELYRSHLTREQKL